MKKSMRTLIAKTLVGVQLLALLPMSVLAAPLNISDTPLFVSNPVAPIVMLDVARDHQLFYKAYNDYSDLDGDGALETTYKHRFPYYGYFDSYKCYDYVVANARFEPASIPDSTNPQPEPAKCSGRWSGNFLNWLAMSRVDVMRKVLYGGTRSTDTATDTVLERAYLPTDAHSWAKYYNGDGGAAINEVTPFTTTITTAATYTSSTSATLGTFDARTASSITRSSSTATVTLNGHGFSTGQKVVISGANQSQYNGVITIATTTANTFTYSVSGSPSSPATGTITAVPLFQVTVSGAPVGIGDQFRIQANTSNFSNAVVTQIYGSSLTSISGATSGTNYIAFASETSTGSGTFSSWTLMNLSSPGISFCNTTYAPSTEHSQTTTYPPLIRVARGNYTLWGANERWQCYWSEEKNNTQAGFSGGLRSNGNRYTRSGIAASAENPSRAAVGLPLTGMSQADYVARVKACVSGLINKENCKAYGTTPTYKPVGLLQDYGEGTNPKITFGLMTGSYQKNVSGGVLRKNVGNLNDEINNGVTSGTNDGTLTSAVGIVKTIDKLRMYGYDYNDGTYIGQDSCTYQQIGIVPSGGQTNGGYPASEGNCSSWGNPMSEIYLESLRYLGQGQTSPLGATSAFSYGSGSKDAALGLPSPAWSDPINSQNYCAPLNALMFNASVSSYDNDQMGGITDIGSTNSAAAITKTIGDAEGITNSAALIGDAGGGTYNGLCTSKTITDLGIAAGLCPEAPSLQGSYLGSGAAYYAHVNRIRTTPNISSSDTTSYKVKTYGVALATNVPRITVPINGTNVTIQPAYRLDRSDVAPGRYGTGTIVDFRIVNQTATSGTLYVNWEDSNQGGDYDQDVIGILTYNVSGSNISVTTQIIAASTANPQGFGYIISGTNKDGAHFHSGIYGFSYTDPTTISVSPNTNVNSSGGCSSCSDDASNLARTATYSIGSGAALSLKDPLFYAAKWGGFVDSDSNNTPNLTSEWDAKNVDGTSGQDGLPDTFFFVNNPAALENSLNAAFLAIVSSSAASAVATNSSSLQTGSTVYQARFNPLNWSGEVLAYPISTTGVLGTTPSWNAGTLLANPVVSSRVILTYSPSASDGTAFEWTSIDATQQALLKTSTTDTQGQARLNYLRGDASNEGIAAGQFRARPTTKLGDIVDSNPQFVGAPVGQYGADSGVFQGAYDTAAYRTFKANNSSRRSMLYVGANDGMLHGFDAATGTEKLAYVPNAVFPNLISLTNPSYGHLYYVDGTPVVADAFINSAWKTVLVGGLNKGGRGIYALDVTNPGSGASTGDFTETNAANVVLWEFTSANDADLGYTFGQPMIVKMNNGKWAAIFGNGYNNTGSGRAKLFILFIEDGIDGTWSAADYVKIDTGVGSTSTPNGLSGVNAIDFDGNGTVDLIYAGDLQGNLWKFDVSGTTTSTWGVGYGTTGTPAPLFVACTDKTTATCSTANRQPITTRPEVTFHPQNVDSMLVYFGTGKYLETSDGTDTTQQTVYGIWDNSATVNVTQLQQQTITTDTSGQRTLSTTTVDWTTKKGWYENLPGSGERHVGDPKLVNGTLFYNTFVPSSTPCAFGGTGFLMATDFESGGQPLFRIFDTNNDGIVNSSDAYVSGITVGASLGGSTIIAPGSASNGLGVAVTNPTQNSGGGSSPVIPTTMGVSGKVFAGVRISWRELTPE